MVLACEITAYRSKFTALAACLLALLAGGLCTPSRAADSFPGENMIELKITLPKGETYFRGATDPVADLNVELTLTNKTAKENLSKETVTIPTVARLGLDEVASLEAPAAENMTALEKGALLEKKKSTASKELYPVNKDSLGYGYVEPQLGPHDTVEFVITKLPEEGEVVPENAKPNIIPRDNNPDHINHADLTQTHYLAAGETSPVFTLHVGRYYLVRDPGTYSIKAVCRLVGDNTKPARFAESNEEKFRVMPFKAVNAKIGDIRSEWELYERGYPGFDYLLYQVKTSGSFDEVWYVQRVPVRRLNRWEWYRLCSVKAGTQVQVALEGPKQVAVFAFHEKGDAALYKIDFSVTSPKVTSDVYEAKDVEGKKLRSEGGKAALE